MADEFAARHRLLRLRADPQQRMEDLAVREDVLEHRLFCKRHAVFLHVPRAQLIDDVRDGDLARANLHALAAAYAEIAELREILETVVQKTRENRPDTARVDMPVDVAADECPDRTYVEARGAAHALIDLVELGVTRSFQTAVVQEDDVELAILLDPLAIFLVDDGRRTRDERLVARRFLARAVSRQEAQDLRNIFNLRDELLVADEDDVDARQSRRDTRISFVRHETGRTVLGDAEVRAREAEIRLHELFSQHLACRLNHEGDVARNVLLQLLGEEARALLAIQVNRRHDHVRRVLSRDGKHPFAQVRLTDVNAVRLNVFVEADFLTRHGLRLDDALDIVLLADLEEIVLDRLAVLRTVDHAAALTNRSLELVGELVDVLHGVVLHRAQILAQSLDVVTFIRLQASARILLGEFAESAAKNRIFKLFIDFLAQIACHQPSLPSMFSIAMTKKRLGP